MNVGGAVASSVNSVSEAPARVGKSPEVICLSGHTDAFRELLAVAPELVKSPDYGTMWRTRGADGTPTEGKTAQEVATAAFAQATALIACDVAAYAAEAVQRRIGEHSDVADVRRWASKVGASLREHDPSTGDRPSAA